MIVGLFPEFLAVGGVQRAGCHIAAALQAFAQDRGEGVRFLSLNDPLGIHRASAGACEFEFRGCNRRKLRFTRTALGSLRERPTLVVATHPNLAPIALAMRGISRTIRSVVWAHGVEVWTPLPALRRRALQAADLLVAPSTDTARHLAETQGVQSEKIRVVAWGLDPMFADRLFFASEACAPAGFPAGRVVLTVGRWSSGEKYKGADHLIAAVARLLPETSNLSLVIVGEGDDLPRLRSVAQQAGVSDRVRFLSGLTQHELLACYRGCEIFAMPSRGEGFGLVFLEAMACGKPVIGGAHGGTLDVIEDGVTGLLVRYGEVENLTLVLRRLLKDDALRAQLGQRARERVLERFTFDGFQKRLTEVLREASGK